MSKKYELLGQRFGNLTVVEKCESNAHGEIKWKCICDCGNEHFATSHRLITGETQRCTECKIELIRKANTTHGCNPAELYWKYQNMLTRCYNKKYTLFHRYGGRGIKVCDEWRHSFVAFRDWALSHGYKTGLTLDRIDNDGDYSPNNCRWATVTEQANNRSTNRIVTVNGETDTLANWARRANAKYSYIQHLLDIGMDPDDVIGSLLQEVSHK